jgi:DNA-binding transcriptional LysR family regulator
MLCAMKLRDLEIFSAIMRGGSITEAGRRLGISQPAVSTALKHAEDQLGMQLFRRERGRLQPTPEALDLYPEVEAMFQKFHSIRRYARDLKGLQSGLLSVSSTPTLSYAYICPAVTRFRAAHPNVRMVLHTMTTRQIVDQAGSRQIDFGITANPTSASDVDSEIFATSELLVLMRGDHPLAERRVVRPQDLSGLPVITNTQHSMFHRVEIAFRDAGADLKVAIACNHHMTTCLLVHSGQAVAIVDPWMPTEIVPGLVRRLLRPRLVIHARLIRSRARPLSRVASSFYDELRAVAARIRPIEHGGEDAAE